MPLLARLVLLSALLAASALAAPPPEKAKPGVSLTLIPPSPVTEQVTLDLRGAVWNRTGAPASFEMAFYLDGERPENLLHREALQVAAQAAAGASFRWPAKGRAGKHRVLLVARGGSETRRAERPLEVLASPIRSTGRLNGAWVDIYHHSEAEGRPFNQAMGQMTDAQWRGLVQAMHAIDMDILVITMMFQNFTHHGQHAIEKDGYQGRAYYPSRLFPGRMPIASKDPLEVILSEADRLGCHVFPGVGIYAFFDYTPGSLAWHQRVATELWELYGRHPSFYGWYVSEENPGDLGNSPQRWREVAEFFRQFQAHCRRLAPDKPVMLAPNCFHFARALPGWRQLLPHCDIVCPFGFHRMPAGDLSGPEASRLMQSLCDEAGSHLWMDLETFVFGEGSALLPRPIAGIVADLQNHPTFEKALCYQFPGLLTSPAMTSRLGGDPAVRLYEDYQRFLREGPDGLIEKHLALRKPVALAAAFDPRYAAGGAQALTDGLRGSPAYQDPAWQGYWQSDLEAIVDLGEERPVSDLAAGFLQEVRAGIFLPTRVEFAVSADGKDFRLVATVANTVSEREPGPPVKDFAARVVPATRARYLRVRATNLGVMPAWHAAAGQKAWLFADELLVR